MSAAVAGELGDRAAPGHFHGAVLDLRDLAEGVECRVGELVGRSLVEGERDEDGLPGRAIVGELAGLDRETLATLRAAGMSQALLAENSVDPEGSAAGSAKVAAAGGTTAPGQPAICRRQ